MSAVEALQRRESLRRTSPSRTFRRCCLPEHGGNRKSTFAYDVNGNVTNDATNSLQTSYNLINLPVQTKSGSTVKANYSYLSDGAKASVLNASGAIVEQNDFYPFGTRQQNGLTPLSANRWRFSGKEGYDGAFGIALDDFGARLFDRSSWTSIDPLAEKYYSLSPYAYCAGNPVSIRDAEGNFPLLSNIVGAVVAAGVEYGAQVAANIIYEQNFSLAAFKEVDILDIAVAAGEGFITSGTSIIKRSATKAAVTVGAEVIRNTFDVKPDNDDEAFIINDADQIVTATTIGIISGSISGPYSSSTIKKTSVNKQVQKAKSSAYSKVNAVSGKEAKQMNLKAKQKNLFIDEMNTIIEDEEKEAFGHFFGTGINTYLWNGEEEKQ